MVEKKTLACSASLGRLLLTTAVGASVLGASCSNAGPATYRVTGTVTVDGQPLKEGDILFLPLDRALGPDAGQIRDGKFTFQAKAGSKRVAIRASRPSRISTAMGETTVWKNYLPARYNSQTTLQAEVSPQGDNDFTYHLQSAN